MAAREDKGHEHKGGRKEQGNGGALAPARRGTMSPFVGFDPFLQFRQQFNRLFDQFLPAMPGFWEEGRHEGWGIDVQEEEDAVTVRAEAPGFEPDDFDIQVRGDQLVMSASQKGEEEEKERGYRRWHRQEFYQSITLPAGIDADKVDAEYHNGILTVKLPKNEQVKARKIAVKGH